MSTRPPSLSRKRCALALLAIALSFAVRIFPATRLHAESSAILPPRAFAPLIVRPPDAPPVTRHTIQNTTVTFVENGRTVTKGMRYWRYLPAQYGAPGSRTFPVIISLHGRGETGDLQLAGRVAIARRIQVFNEEMCFVVNGARDCFIVLSPWIERAYEIAYVTAIMAVVDQMPQVDRSRIYLTGLSMGGGMALKFAALPGNASRFAALTPLAAAAGTVVAGDTPCTIADADLPVWALHDVGDAVVSFAQSEAWVNTINGERALPDGSLCGAPTPRARLTALSGFGHQIWDTIYDPSQRYFLDGSTPVNLYHWLLLHRH